MTYKLYVLSEKMMRGMKGNRSLYRHYAFIVVALLITVPAASATTYLNIYLDEQGAALFLGEGVASQSLPSGIVAANGRITGTTNDLTTKTGAHWSFSYELPDAELNVILPPGGVITNLSQGSVHGDGNQLEVYGREKVEISYVIEETTKAPLTPWIVLIILCIVVGISIAVFKMGKRRRQSSLDAKLELAKHLIHEREQLILSKLRETGKVKSSYLRRLCDLPKASFSRHLRELERKKLIVRSGDGRNKFVELFGA